MTWSQFLHLNIWADDIRTYVSADTAQPIRTYEPRCCLCIHIPHYPHPNPDPNPNPIPNLTLNLTLISSYLTNTLVIFAQPAIKNKQNQKW